MKAVYQRYMGWFDGNPAHLWQHPPQEQARRYVEFMGGRDAVLAGARESFAEGDYRWVAEVVNHLVFADPGDTAARELQAEALEQLGYGSENATWRNFFLMGATELREGVSGTPTASAPAGRRRPPLGEPTAGRHGDSPRRAAGLERAAVNRLGGHRP